MTRIALTWDRTGDTAESGTVTFAPTRRWWRDDSRTTTEPVTVEVPAAGAVLDVDPTGETWAYQVTWTPDGPLALEWTEYVTVPPPPAEGVHTPVPYRQLQHLTRDAAAVLTGERALTAAAALARMDAAMADARAAVANARDAATEAATEAASAAVNALDDTVRDVIARMEAGEFVGETGPQGATGPTGPQGERGPMGPQGATGPQGGPGPTGATGPQGERGPAGPAGPQGERGPIGPAGPQGERGLTGPAGPQGAKGDTGPIGPAGPQGAQGVKGDTGAASTVPGPVGPQGPTGPVGPAGPVGPQGVKGDTGAPGVVSSASSYVIVGPGRPDVPSTTAGTITGREPVGAEYRSTDGANVGAFVWMKRPGGKWEVTNGDTGWRALQVSDGVSAAHLDTNKGGALTSGGLGIRRIGTTVYLLGYWYNVAGTPGGRLWALPYGWKLPSTVPGGGYGTQEVARWSGSNTSAWTITNGHYLNISTLPGGENRVYGSWVTADPWPSAPLPGDPA